MSVLFLSNGTPLQFSICLRKFQKKAIDLRLKWLLIIWASIVDISSWLQLCFQLILTILQIAFCSTKQNWNENDILTFKNVFFFQLCFVSRNRCRENWNNISKESVEVVCNIIFNVNFISIYYKIWWGLFIFTLIEQFVYGGQDCFIFDTDLSKFDS